LPPSDPWELALEGVLVRFAVELDALAGRMRLDPAERDALLQEIRLRLWKAAPEVEKLEAIGPSFLYRAARWAALDLLRERRSMGNSTMFDEGTAAELPAREQADDTLERSRTAATLDRAVATLRPDRRTVVSLWLAGYHRTEIAPLLGWGEHRVRNLLYRGLEDLRASLGAAGYEPQAPGVRPLARGGDR
jgi:RNA polymerase sigma factor (sigma-70 family)